VIADLIGLALLLLLGLGLGYNPFRPALGGWLAALARAPLAPLMGMITVCMLLGWISLYHQGGMKAINEDGIRSQETQHIK
jgi:hypothetical protein